jgi:hypothetical protein
LKLHSFDQEMSEQGVAVLRDQAGSSRGTASERGQGRVDGEVVVIGLGSVDGREERLGEPVLGDQSLLDDKQDLGPDFSDSVDSL